MNKNDTKTELLNETVLEPELLICDAHHHILDTHAHYLLNAFLADARTGHNVDKTVAIECGYKYRTGGPDELKPIGETEFLAELSPASKTLAGNKTEVAAGIVGTANLMLGDKVAPVLEQHIAAGKGRFRGLRVSTAWDASPEFHSHAKVSDLLGDSEFRKGFAQLKKYNLSFDAWIFFHQMTGLAQLAAAFPDTTIILDHMGGPLGTGLYADRKKEANDVWKKGIAKLAEYHNVVVKLGGLGMPQVGLGWQQIPAPPNSIHPAEIMAPYINYCIEKFGTQRCMFESNFPVDKMSYSYIVCWNAFKRITKTLSKSERADLFYNVAARVYRL